MESSEIKIGDLVEQYKHYEFDETKTAILKLGPSSENADTKWRFLGFGIYKDKDKYELVSSLIEELKQTKETLQRHVDFDGIIELLEIDKELDEEPVVELELVEGICQHKAFSQESELSQSDSQKPELLIDDEKNEEELPGYIRRVSNALGYRRSFPHASPYQQFFDEWRKVS